MKKTFGNPKLLPGQAGYNLKESELLENDAKEMETRLKILQEKIVQQQSAAENKVSDKSPSSKWRSSRGDKGGIRSYAKDVVKSIKKRSDLSMDGTMNVQGTSNARRLLQQEQNRNDLTTIDVEQWTVANVGDWLKSIQLDQYVEVFLQNEISGNILTDITLEDLDYMNITTLGHRKLIIKGAEELKKNKKILNANHRNITAKQPTLQKNQILVSKTDDDVSLVKDSSHQNPVHWSHLEPLVNKKVTNPTSMVNLADGEYNEEAEREAFSQAVNEWRQSGVKSNETGSSKPSKVQMSWENELLREENNRRHGVVAQDDGMWHNSFGSSEEKVTPVNLAAGVLDEQKEHEEFVKAVEAWRSGGKSKDTAKPSTATHPEGDKSTGSGSPVRVFSTITLAESLAKEFEIELQISSQRIQKQKEEAEAKLAKANQDLQSLRQTRRDGDQILTPVGSPKRYSDANSPMSVQSPSDRLKQRKEFPIRASDTNIPESMMVKPLTSQSSQSNRMVFDDEDSNNEALESFDQDDVVDQHEDELERSGCSIVGEISVYRPSTIPVDEEPDYIVSYDSSEES